MATTAGKSALLLGATGAVGQRLLAELLANPSWTRVGEFGRRVSARSGTIPPTKLEQGVVDFEDVAQLEQMLKPGRWDVVFVTLGTTRAAAGSAALFEKIDREYVVRACKAAKSDDQEHVQRVVYLSSSGANPTSPFLYTKSKGLTELALARLGYADAIVFRPGYLRGAKRADARIGEAVLGLVTGVAKHFSANAEIEISLLAKSLSNAGFLGSAGIPPDVGATTVDEGDARFTLLSNSAAVTLGGK